MVLCAMNRALNTIPITVLVCDDGDDRDTTRRALLEAHLSNTVRFVADGAEMLDYLYQRGPYAGETGTAPRPGLILVDLRSPRTHGDLALAQIREDRALRTIPVIDLSISATPQHLMPPGVTAAITKPVTLSGLLAALSVVDRYRLEIVEIPEPRA
jgi:CheY-like chemotaxis protein